MTPIRRPEASAPRLTAGELAVTRHLLMHGPSTRGGLGEALQLSYASMSRLARSLVNHGVLAEELERDQVKGRPRQILSIIPTARHVVGVKLTRGRAYAVACDMFGIVLSTTSAPMPAPGRDGVVPIHSSVALIARLVQRLAKQVPSVDCVGVSIGGPVVDHARVHATFLNWYDVDLRALVEAAVDRPVAVSNDVAALSREQLWFGAGRTHSTFGVLTVGAGLGFGFVRDGHVVEHLIDDGYLLAHAPIDASGPTCSFGHPGCAASYLNRADVERRASDRLRRAVTFRELAEAAKLGQRLPSQMIDEAAVALGHLVATCAGALQTDRIVLAGEDIDVLTGPDSAMHAVIRDRTGQVGGRAPKAVLNVTTARDTFNDWAQGAAVVAIQEILDAV